MKTKIIFLVASIFTLISCSKEKANYSKFDLFPETHQWKQSDAKTFDFTIDNDSQSYDIVFKFSHVFDYQFNSVPINFVMETPDGKKEKFTIDLQIKDSSGKQLADCSGDVCDLTLAIKDNIKLAKGNYKITVTNSFKGPYLPNVIGVGLEVNGKN